MNRVKTAFATLSASLVVAGIALSLGLALGQDPPTEQPTQDPTLIVFFVEKTYTDELPQCFDSAGGCTYRLRRIDVQTRAKGLLEVDLYGERGGKEFFAWAQRRPVGARWLWVIRAENRFFLRAVRAWSKGHAEVSAIRFLPDLPKFPILRCQGAAAAALINVTTDAGTLAVPPPVVACGPRNDAGAPDCSVTPGSHPAPVMRCGDFGAYYLGQLKHQGWKAEGSDEPDGGAPPSKLVGRTPRLTPGVPTRWGFEADAATTKTCTVPIGTPCP